MSFVGPHAGSHVGSQGYKAANRTISTTKRRMYVADCDGGLGCGKQSSCILSHR